MNIEHYCIDSLFDWPTQVEIFRVKPPDSSYRKIIQNEMSTKTLVFATNCLSNVTDFIGDYGFGYK